MVKSYDKVCISINPEASYLPTSLPLPRLIVTLAIISLGVDLVSLASPGCIALGWDDHSLGVLPSEWICVSPSEWICVSPLDFRPWNTSAAVGFSLTLLFLGLYNPVG